MVGHGRKTEPGARLHVGTVHCLDVSGLDPELIETPWQGRNSSCGLVSKLSTRRLQDGDGDLYRSMLLPQTDASCAAYAKKARSHRARSPHDRLDHPTGAQSPRPPRAAARYRPRGARTPARDTLAGTIGSDGSRGALDGLTTSLEPTDKGNAERLSRNETQIRAGKRQAGDRCRVSAQQREILLQSGWPPLGTAFRGGDATTGASLHHQARWAAQFPASRVGFGHATYEPVDQYEPAPIRNQIIERDYPLLRDDLGRLTPDRSAPVVLIKVNICELLEVRLMHDGFNVLNRGVKIPFPANGHQVRFRAPFRAALESAGISVV
jgi:hypothetical protein